MLFEEYGVGVTIKIRFFSIEKMRKTKQNAFDIQTTFVQHFFQTGILRGHVPTPEFPKNEVCVLKPVFSGFQGNSKRWYRASLAKVTAPVPAHEFPEMRSSF